MKTIQTGILMISCLGVGAVAQVNADVSTVRTQVEADSNYRQAQGQLKEEQGRRSELETKRAQLEGQIEADKLPAGRPGEKGVERMMMMQARSGRLFPVYKQLRKTQSELASSAEAIARLDLNQFVAYFNMLKSTVSFETQEISLFRYKESVMNDYMAGKINKAVVGEKLAAFEARMKELRQAVANDAAAGTNPLYKATATEYIQGIEDQIRVVSAYRESVETIEAQRDALVAKDQLIKSLNVTVETLKGELSAAREELAKSLALIKEREAQIASLNLQIEASQGNVGKLKEMVRSLRAENEALALELAVTQDVVAKSQAHLKGIRDESEAKSSMFRDFTKERLTFDADAAAQASRRVIKGIQSDRGNTNAVDVLDAIK